MAYLTQKRCVGFKLEASPYTRPQADLQQADYNFKAYNVGYSTEIEEAKRQYSLGTFMALSSILGKRSGTVSFSIDLGYSGTAITPPEFGKILKACGFAETIGLAGITYIPKSSLSAIPAMIEVAELSEENPEKQLVIQLRGAMGNVKFTLDSVGKPVRADFEFKGVLQGIKDRATAILPAGYDATSAEAVLGAVVTAFDEALDLEKIEIDLGNTVELFVDPAASEGYSGAHIVGRAPTVSLDPYMGSISQRPIWGRMTANTTGVFEMNIGENMAFDIPALQVVKGYDGSERTGAVVNNLSCIVTKGTVYDLRLLHGAEEA